MGQEYTPSSGEAFPDYPVIIFVNNDVLTESFLNTIIKDVYNRMDFLNNSLEGSGEGLAALTENLGTNVGDVTSEEENTYAGTVIVQNGDSHHEGIEKLDGGIAANAATGNANATGVLNNAGYITNIIDKIDPLAGEVADLVYSSHNFITVGDRLKTVVEKFDRLFAGTRRAAELSYSKTFSTLLQTLTALGHADVYASGYDTFYTNDKVNPGLTSATIDTEYQTAVGSAKDAAWTENTPGQTMQEIMIDWENSFGGSVEVRFHLNGDTNWSNMQEFTAGKNQFQVASVTGTNLVIRARMSGVTALYNLSYVAKG